MKHAICEKLKQENDLEYTPSQIAVSCGAKHSIYNILQVLLDPEDEVLIPAPYWVSYTEMVKLAGGKPVILETTAAASFKVQPEQIRKAVTPKTKALILNSPSNPTGTVYTKEELSAIGAILVENSITCISDEIYEKLTYHGAEHHSIAAVVPDLKENTILVNGVSKTYAMTGWRIGYIAGPESMADDITKLQSHSTSNPCSISQMAALTAITGDQKIVEDMRKAFETRLDLICTELDKASGFVPFRGNGAFYVFTRVSDLYTGDINTSLAFADYCLEKAEIALVPGGAFGMDEYVRLSFAVSEEDIREGIRRLSALFS